MASEVNWSWTEIHSQNKKALRFILSYLRHPVAAIQNIPVFDWPTIVFVHVILTICGGLIGGLLSGSLLGLLSGVFVFPLTSVLSLAVIAALFYYGFQFFLKRTLSFRKTFWLIALAHIPITISMIFASWLPLASFIGASASTLLLIIGMTENFALPRKTVIKFVGALYVVYLALWIANSLMVEEDKVKFQQKATPESLDILERELKASE